MTLPVSYPAQGDYLFYWSAAQNQFVPVADTSPLPASGPANVFKTIAAVAITAGTPVAVWTPAAGKKFRVLGFMLSLSVAGSVILKDGGNANAEILRTPLMAAGVGLASPDLGRGVLGSAANGSLNLDASASGSVSGFVFGTEE